MVKNLKRYRKQLEREFGKAEAQKYPYHHKNRILKHHVRFELFYDTYRNF